MVTLNLGIVFWAGMEVGKRWWPWRLLDLRVSLARTLKECVSQGHVQFCLATKPAVPAPSIPALAGLFSIFLGMLMEAVCWLVEHAGFGIRSKFFPALTLINYVALGCHWAHFRIKILTVPGSWDCRNNVMIIALILNRVLTLCKTLVSAFYVYDLIYSSQWNCDIVISSTSTV